ncbi:hypothetical protein THAOC_31171 [Thalassiosira oceanica]|uniref:Uncharacterized protein n=1 Tax=Thalassiosira oceanica TaxID=159749 RepID=K0R8N7_THAOC|nr:hypothetical protein THAOC_31171 [Thalassiosira oceanica]|eukprot:EJK49903.1 hypothetical protein THAOC_31171 [Thalassiosira oceanica]
MANQKPVSSTHEEESRRMKSSTPKDPDGLRGSLLERQKRRRGRGATSSDEESRRMKSSTPKEPEGLRGSLLKKQKRRGRGEEAASPTRGHATDYSLGDRLPPSDLRRFRRAKSEESLTPKGRVFVRRADRTFTCAEFEGVNRQGMLRFRVNEAGSFKEISPEKLSSHVLAPTTGCDSPGCDSRTEAKVSPPPSPRTEAKVSPPSSPVVTDRVDGKLETIHKVGDCVIYQGRGGFPLQRFKMYI